VVRSDHPIFRGPYPVTPTLKEVADPYRNKKYLAWAVSENVKSQGLVSTIEQFLDAEDSEIISGGVNMKGDHGVALVREADRFMWGPAAKPSQMTEEARRVFVNMIVYMKRFDGARQTVWRGLPVRSAAFDIINADHIRTKLELGDWFAKGIVDRLGEDKQKYRALFEANIGYVHIPHGTHGLDIDTEAQSIGIPNNDVRFIDKCITLLQKPAEAAKAQRLLERYTGQSFKNAKAWQAWFEENKSKLYFSDGYDYRFYSGPAGPDPAPTVVPSLLSDVKPSDPSNIQPVTISR
jgi:hypothetical protein